MQSARKNRLIEKLKNNKYQIIMLSIFALLLPTLNPWIRGDAVGYYAYLRSAVIDGDLDFRNEYQRGNETFKMAHSGYLSDSSKLTNPFGVGLAILVAPFFLVAHLIVFIMNGMGSSIPPDGYSTPYLYVTAFGSALYGFIGLLLSYDICKKYFSETIAFVSTLSIWFASSIMVYMYLHPFMSHSVSLFAVSLFLWLWHKTIKNRNTKSWFLLGLVGGLIAIIRYAEIVFLIVPVVKIIILMVQRKEKPNRKIFFNLSVYLAGPFLSMIPSFISNTIVHGSPLNNGHSSSEFRNYPAYFFKVLFSSNHGAFLWTPMLFFATIGLIFFWKKDKVFTIVLSSAYLLLLYVVGSVIVWFGGSSYGNRFLICLTPIFILGLAALLEKMIQKVSLKYVSIIIAIFVIWNGLFIFQWCMGMVPRSGPISWRDMVYNQVAVVPKTVVKTGIAYFSNRDVFRRELEKEEVKRYEEEPPRWDDWK